MKLFLYFKKEFLHVFPLFLFFLIVFTIINEIETFLFLRAGMTPHRFIEVLLAAGLITKIVLVLDHMQFLAKFKKKPLIYGVVWKTLIYSIILLFVRFLIKLTPFVLIHNETIKKAVLIFFDNNDWQLFFSVQVFYLIFLFIYVTFKELSDKIGKNKIKKLFFGEAS